MAEIREIRLNDLPVLVTPTGTTIVHSLDDTDDKDKQLDLAAVRAFAQVGTATAAQGARADTALQPGSVNLGTTANATTRTVTNTGGTSAVLPTFNTAAGLVPGTASGTTNFLRADGTWAAPPAGGGGGVSAVSGTAPIAVATGTTTPVVSIAAATTAAAGSMSGADKTKLDGVATGATANSTDAQLRDRGTHTGTQAAATISDFTASSRAQVEATLTAGSNITLTATGSGATRSIAIASTAAGGGGGTVTSVTGTAPIQVASGTTTPAITITAATPSLPGSMSAADKTKLDTLTAGANGTVTSVTGGAGLTGSVTTSGALAVGAGTGITVNADDVAINRTVVDPWYATAAQGTLAGTALQPGSVDLGYTAASRTITNTAGDSTVLPLFGTAAGLVPGTTSGTTNFLRADGTWAAPAGGGGGTVTSVTGGAGLTGAVTTSGALAVGQGTGITVNADDVAVNRTVVDTWYLPMDISTLPPLP